MKVTLALDLATQCGYALLRADGKIESGSVRFAPKTNEGPGMRFVRFRAWLAEMKQLHPDIGRIVWEKVVAVGVNQAYAAQIHGGFVAIMQSFAEHNQIEYEGFNVATVKKQFAGSGRAQKCDMIEACKALEFRPVDDNEADAIALLHVATGTAPILTMSGATPKKRAPKPQPELAPGANPF